MAQGLKLETIANILENWSCEEHLWAGINACEAWSEKPKTEEELEMVDEWARDERWWYRTAGLYAYGPKRAPKELAKEGLICLQNSMRTFQAAVYAARGKRFDADFVIALAHRNGRWILGDLPDNMNISKTRIRDLLERGRYVERYLAVRACTSKKVPLDWLLGILKRNVDSETLEAAARILRSKNVSRESLLRWWSQPGLLKRDLSLLLIGRDDMKDLIRAEVNKGLSYIPRACEGVHFALEDIDVWRHADDLVPRLAAVYASIGRSDVPGEWIKQLLEDPNSYISRKANEACWGRRDLSFRRDFEPPELVYKKCLGDVIVTATIPADAEIRGLPGTQARTNKATIVDVSGEFYGEKVGVADYDQETTYHVGDEVFIPDFDFGSGMCTTGFHFFSSLDEAKEY